ncbi:MAG: reverse transcriptase family protein, partial [Candidatus Omnitrophica bacterium]|nr:reverse transcriptase family protein [Candidatus Omnitrophota bacterium]
GKGIIVNLHKNGDRSDPGNFRGITLFSCLEKVFSTIMNNRLSVFLKNRDVIAKNQRGFQKKARTSDHLFIIRTLMDKYVRKENTSLYICFVDFSKAYDSIWHLGLFLKMLRNGIRGKFYSVVKDLYQKSESCVKMTQGRSDFFRCMSGVKQGEPLSPALFNLYVNDLSKKLDMVAESPSLGPELVSHLLWADDLVILSTSSRSLQNKLDVLTQFCQEWKLNVNVKKTKVMKLSKSGRLPKENFYITNSKVDAVTQYKYLGVVIAASGTFSYARHNIAQRAKKAMFKLKSCIGYGAILPSLGLKMFDQVVAPVCMYGSEIWSLDNLDKSKKFERQDGLQEFFHELPIEKVNLSFCKYLLGVNKKSGNLAVRAELGRLPLGVRVVC